MTAFPETRPRVAAGVVLYHPDPTDLISMVGALAGQVECVILYCNSSLADDHEKVLAGVARPAELVVYRAENNDGLGAAHNWCLAHARERGVSYVLILDQDSDIPKRLVQELVSAFTALSSGGSRPIAVGPHPVHPDGRLQALNSRTSLRGKPEAIIPVHFLISSGMLVHVGGFADVGAFRADFFIDGIDLEWCFRAWSKGRSIHMVTQLRLPHRLGQGVRPAGLGLRLVRQPPTRVYTYLRNQIEMCRLPHVPFRWKARFLVSLPARCLYYLAWNRCSAPMRAALARGMADGWRGQLGSPESVWTRLNGP